MTMPKWFLVIVVLVALDQASKAWVVQNLELYDQVDLLPFLAFFRTYNEGVAFSMLSGLGPWPLIALTLAIISFIAWLVWHTPASRWISLAGYSFILAGAFGNLIDRVLIGKVVDMILFHIESLNFRFAVFNLADTFITIGAALIILDEVLQWRKTTKQNKET